MVILGIGLILLIIALVFLPSLYDLYHRKKRAENPNWQAEPRSVEQTQVANSLAPNDINNSRMMRFSEQFKIHSNYDSQLSNTLEAIQPQHLTSD